MSLFMIKVYVDRELSRVIRTFLGWGGGVGFGGVLGVWVVWEECCDLL